MREFTGKLLVSLGARSCKPQHYRCIALVALLGLAANLGTAEAQVGQIWYKPGFPGQAPTYPNYLGAPSGMPDFDQNQNFDGNNNATINPQERADGVDLYYCAPTAAANCLWWFGSVRGRFPVTYGTNTYATRYPALADVNLDGAIDRLGADNAMALVQSLANLMDTNDQRIVGAPANPDGSPNMGTWVPANMPAPWYPGTGDGFGQVGGYGLEPGLREYIQVRNVPLAVRSIALPNFDHFQTELLSCNNIILTVANPANGGIPPSEPWPVPGNQTGYHCVTAAGVYCDTGGNPRNPKVAISDPWADWAESGQPGRVLPQPGHPAPGHAANVHNDPQMVSQDAYNVKLTNVGLTQTFQLANYNNLPNNDATVVWMTVVYPTAITNVSFSVTANAQGIVPAQSPINSVRTLNAAAQPNDGEVFDSSTRRGLSGLMAGNNQTSISRANLGLLLNENIDSLSYGKDAGNVVYFSVDRNAVGMPNTAVMNESTLINPNFPLNIPNPQNPGGGAPGQAAAGDVFKALADKNSRVFGRYYEQKHVDNGLIDNCWICDNAENPAHPLNRMFIDAIQIGLQSPTTAGQPPQDDLDAFEYAAANDPVWGVNPGGAGKPQQPVFFTVNNSLQGLRPCDILYSINGNAPQVFADGFLKIGLVPGGTQQGDRIDALALADVTLQPDPNKPGNYLVFANPDNLLNPQYDEALFSLAPGSPSLAAGGFSPGDIFYTDFTGTFSLWTSAASLGLQSGDNLDALDVVVPEPSTFALLAVGGLGLIGWVWLRRRA